jgi:4'-phosphopantetheinyl transferase
MPQRNKAGLEIVLALLHAPADAVRSALGLLSTAERQRAARLRFERHRRRFIVARARLRELLATRLGVRPEAVELAYGANGKPQLPRPELHFSVSHCDDVALFAFSPEREVGIDVEALRPIHEADAIAAQVFSPRERSTYATLAARDRALAFLRCWTRKEALVKALGDGLSLPLDQLDAASAPGWRVHSFFPLPGFIAAVACPRNT